MSKMPTRLFDFPRYQLESRPQTVMMTSPNNGNRLTYSTAEFVAEMDRASAGLVALGMQPGDRVALISHNNRCEWNVMDCGIVQAGGIDVPIYPTMTAEDYVYILNHSEARWCFVSNKEIWDKLDGIRDRVPGLEGVYTFEMVEGAPSWREVLVRGGAAEHEEVRRRAEGVGEEDLATIIYTSGTTGRPKGVMLTHRNIAKNVAVSIERLPAVDYSKAYRVLSFLPACHIFERMLHYLYMYVGAQIHFAESLETVKDDLAATRPHMFTAVPRLLEKFYDGITAKGAAAGGVKAKIFAWAVGLALRWEPDGQNGALYEFQLKIARKLVFDKVKLALGLEEIQAVASGSAALAPRLARFFNAAGIPVYEGYGLTETSPVVSVTTLNRPDMLRVGYVGKLVEGVEVKFAADGEILVRGHNIMQGYYKEPEMTTEVLKDGWFHTGDIGVMDDGFLKITDRKKEMFKTSGGKYVAPQLLENAIKASRFIEQVMVVGDGRKTPGALVVPDAAGVEVWCGRHGHPFPGLHGIADDPVLVARIEKDVADLMEPFAPWERVKIIRVLRAQFTIDAGELTPTLKLKRKPITERYAAEIEAMYAE